MKVRRRIIGLGGLPYGLLLLLILYNLFFIAYGLQKHAAFETTGFDLGIWDQKMWVLRQGRPFIITTQAEVEHSLGDHVDLAVMLLALPFYAFYPSPKTLIVFQTALVSAGALPIYWLARDKLRGHWAGLVFAAVYLLFPALQGAVTFDMHGVTVAAPLLAFALWGMYQQRYRLFLVFALLVMGCQEDMPLLTLMMGLYIAAIHRRLKVGGLTVLVSLAWFGLANFVIRPAFGLEGQIYHHIARYGALGDSLGEVIVAIFTRPHVVLRQILAGEKKLYWIRLTMPTAFTALLDPLTLLLALPSLLINTLSDYPPTYQLDRFHSSAPIAPFVVAASIRGVERLVRWAGPKFRHVPPAFLRNVLLGMVLLVTLIYQVQFGHTPIGRYFAWPAITGHDRRAEQLIARIPPQAAVAAQNSLAPHLSRRTWIFILPKLSQQGTQAEYIVMDLKGGDLTPYESVAAYCAHLNRLLTDPAYGLVAAEDGLLLFRRGAAGAVRFRPGPPCE